MGKVTFKISVSFVTAALIALALSLYLSNYYLREQARLAETGDLKGARVQVERAARLDPFSPAPPASAAYIELRQGRPEAAARAFQQAIRRDPANYENYAALGNLQAQQLGDPVAAVESYREALRRNPLSNAVVSRLAEALLSTEDYEGAREQYEWLRENAGISAKELYTLGRVQVRLGVPEKAIETLEEVRESVGEGLESLDEPQRAEMRALLESVDLAIADALIAQGSYAEAREHLSQSEAEQAPAILALLANDPEGYRRSALEAPIS